MRWSEHGGACRAGSLSHPEPRLDELRENGSFEGYPAVDLDNALACWVNDLEHNADEMGGGGSGAGVGAQAAEWRPAARATQRHDAGPC